MVIDDLNDEQVLTLTIYGEARGEGLDGMLGVASVVLNRTRRGNTTVKSECLKKKQFSCFNEGDPNRALLERFAEAFNDYVHQVALLRACMWIARGAMSGILESNVGGATHYHTKSILPYWAKDARMKKIRELGNHVYYHEK